MKHNKLIIAGILALALTACTSNTNTAEETSSATTENTSAVAEAETSAEESTTTTDGAEVESEAAEEDVPADDTANSELIATYVDVLSDKINSGEFSDAWGMTALSFLPLDINNDSMPELLYSGYLVQGDILDIDGNSLDKGFYCPDDAKVSYCEDVETGDTFWLTNGKLPRITVHDGYDCYAVRTLGGHWDSLLVDVYDDGTIEGTMGYYTDGIDFTKIETADTKEGCYDLYDRYFGKYMVIDEFTWSDKAVFMPTEFKDACLAQDASTCQDELYDWVESMLTSYYE